MQVAPESQMQRHLFSRFPKFTSHDAEEVRHQVSRIFCDHDLKVVGRSQSLNTEIHFRQGKRVSYGRMLYGATVDIEPGKLDDFYLIQIPVAGQEAIQYNRRAILSNIRVATIISPDLEFRMRHERNAEKLFIRVERSALEQQCTQYYGHLAHGALHFNPAIHLQHPAMQSLKRLLDWQLYEASEGDLFNQPLIAARFEEILMVSLLGSLEHNQPVRFNADPVAPGFVKRAEDYIRNCAHQPLTAGDIADHVGVSIRSLFAGFRKYRNTSPMRYLKQTRLEHVRQELLNPTMDTTVTQMALRWGFTHLGQFSSGYQQRFGERPSETLKRSAG
jgi:AraC-like DNA-binding protein